MARRKKPWTETVQEHGVKVRLFERGGAIYRDVILGRTVSENGAVRTAHDVRSMKHGSRERAKAEAKELCAKIAEARLTGVTPDTITLAQVFAQYREHYLAELAPKWAGNAATRMELFMRAWGGDMRVADIGQDHVDRFCRLRRSGELSPFDPADAPERKGRKPRAVKDGTLDGDFRWLSSVFNWAWRWKEGGRRLLHENPLAGVTRPREKNPLQPVASQQRYTKTQAHADAVDPTGRLRCILALARYTGRREGAILQLRAADLLLTHDKIRDKLAAIGQDEGRADKMPDGAIFWSAEADKQGVHHVAPISKPMRQELDRYLRRNPRIGDAPLFPGTRGRGKPGEGDDPRPAPRELPMRGDVAARWLLEAERKAGLPKLRHGIWHPYRRLWATERKHLPDVDVAAAGGWGDVVALRKSYQHADPDTLLAVVRHGT